MREQIKRNVIATTIEGIQAMDLIQVYLCSIFIRLSLNLIWKIGYGSCLVASTQVDYDKEFELFMFRGRMRNANCK